jgi:Uma2 family endonuclease
MSAEPKLPERPMTVQEFLAWSENQPGRYELQDGVIHRMQSERARHAIVKAHVYTALYNAVRVAGLPCTVFPDGMTVVVNDETTYEPDCVVQCVPIQDLDAVIVDAPMIVVEVSSPSTQSVDRGRKLPDYLSIASVMHVLQVDPRRRRVVHHARSGSAFMARLLTDADVLDFDPPGFSVPVALFFAGLDAARQA